MPVITGAGMAGLLLACVVIIAVPGPSIMYLVGQALAAGRRIALLCVLGNAFGMFLVALLVAFGLAELLRGHPWLQPLLRYTGAAVLALIALGYLRTRHPLADGPTPAPDDGAGQRGASSAFGSAVLVGVSNPKALIMFGAIVPSFLTPGARPSAGQLLLLSAIPLSVGVILDSGWVQLATWARTWLSAHPGRIVMLNRVGGALMLGMVLVMVMGG